MFDYNQNYSSWSGGQARLFSPINSMEMQIFAFLGCLMVYLMVIFNGDSFLIEMWRVIYIFPCISSVSDDTMMMMIKYGRCGEGRPGKSPYFFTFHISRRPRKRRQKFGGSVRACSRSTGFSVRTCFAGFLLRPILFIGCST